MLQLQCSPSFPKTFDKTFQTHWHPRLYCSNSNTHKASPTVFQTGKKVYTTYLAFSSDRMAFHSLLEPHADAVVDTHRLMTAVLNMPVTLSPFSSLKSISATRIMVYNGHREISLVVAGRRAPQKSLVLAWTPTYDVHSGRGGGHTKEESGCSSL